MPVREICAKGSAGGRPPSFDVQVYKMRNTVERGYNRLKHWRGIATRYAVTYLGGVILAATILHGESLRYTP